MENEQPTFFSPRTDRVRLRYARRSHLLAIFVFRLTDMRFQTRLPPLLKLRAPSRVRVTATQHPGRYQHYSYMRVERSSVPLITSSRQRPSTDNKLTALPDSATSQRSRCKRVQFDLSLAGMDTPFCVRLRVSVSLLNANVHLESGL
jgi:hypothetical protein